MAVNSEGNKIVIAADTNPQTQTETSEEETSENTSGNSNTNTESQSETSDIEAIVQRNLDAYNARDIDAFMNDYADDVKLYAYPNSLQTEGKENMRKNYEEWFKRVPDLRAYVKKRIVFKNKVIDEEQVTANGKILNAVAIYEVENGKIVRVTFIQ